jgi:hypothetical protein
MDTWLADPPKPDPPHGLLRRRGRTRGRQQPVASVATACSGAEAAAAVQRGRRRCTTSWSVLCSRSINIPAFIPGKVNELLAELAWCSTKRRLAGSRTRSNKRSRDQLLLLYTTNGNNAMTSSVPCPCSNNQPDQYTFSLCWDFL